MRAIDQQAVVRVGGSKSDSVTVRLVAATSRDVQALRLDLIHRLAATHVRCPPLRERTDLLALAAHVLGHEEARLASAQHRRPRSVALAADARDALARHRWPGNVRELRSVLVQALVEAPGDVAELTAADLRAHLGALGSADSAVALVPDDLSFTDFARGVRLAFVAALARHLGQGPAGEALRMGGKSAVGNAVRELHDLVQAKPEAWAWLLDLVPALAPEDGPPERPARAGRPARGTRRGRRP